MKTIVIRTLGGNNIGYGHFYRCLSLAKAIRLLNKDINIIFLINQELMNLIEVDKFEFIVSNTLKADYDILNKMEIDLFVLDSYLGDDYYLKTIKSFTKLMLIDDNNDIYDSSIPDIIYNGNIHAESLNYKEVDTQLMLLGVEYLIMKEEYWDVEYDNKTHKEGVLITTGGSDQYEVAIRILESVKDIDCSIKVIIGPGYKDDYIKRLKGIKGKHIELIHKPSSLKKYIKSSQIVVTAGGSTVYEVLSQKSIPIVFSIADNQDLICKGLKDNNISYIGKYPDIKYSKIYEIINGKYNLINNTSYYKNVKLDGKGSKRVSLKILENIQNKKKV